MRIGSLELRSPFVLAPMAGYTQRPFRELCLRMGAGLAYTELVVAEGVARRMEATLAYLDTSPEDQPVAAHLFGSTPDAFARAAAVVEERGGFALLDVNAGCPVRKVTSKGAGAALLKDPENLGHIVRRLKEATRLPVTVKTRIGRVRGDGAGLAVVRAAEEAGADAVCIHARYVSDRHSGLPYWDELAPIVEQVAIPVIGNGGVKTAAQAFEMMRQTGVRAVMIGRGALGNPWIFRELDAVQRGVAWRPPSREEILRTLLDHARRTVDMVVRCPIPRRLRRYTPEQEGIIIFRAHLLKYLSGRAGAKSILRERGYMIDSLAALEGLLERLDKLWDVTQGEGRAEESERWKAPS